jgi:hypothetical protein
MASSSDEKIESPLPTPNPTNQDEQYRKLFIGGLSYTTTDDNLK